MVVKGGPAPNVYKLPTLVGYQAHDTTKTRNPAYTIRSKLAPDKTGLGPGLYDLSTKTRYGPSKSPAYTFSIYHKEYSPVTKSRSPGPIVYAPVGVRKENPPKYTIGHRTKENLHRHSPGPNIYTLPPVLGPKVPNKPTIGAFSMGLKAKEMKSEGIPGPNKYDSHRCLNAVKKKMPGYTMGSRVWPPDPKKPYPSANRYYIKPPKKPGFTFGVRPNSSKYTYFTVDDLQTLTTQRI
ncbi:protein CIMAP1D-like [Lycorma delicatula]|uniref:protein CIMAP1D-like n=1 Tax=Lycorma delicatula TaxID=130591 RepID=UPI003F511F5F